MKKDNFNKKEETLFRIYEIDDYGMPTSYLGVFIANTKEDARKIASKYYKNKEIITTGFYKAKEITQKELDKEYEELMKEIKFKTKILNQK